MANEIVKINGVTKQEFNDDFVYSFPTATIITNTSLNSFQTTQINDYANPRTRKFDDVTDKLGQTTLVGYIDELARKGFFFDSESNIFIAEQEEAEQFAAGSGHVKTDFESIVRSNLKEQTELLKKVVKELKSMQN